MTTPTLSAPARISYPPDLPITARREDLLAAIRDHQVVIVAGETGSGKTTQLPKLCLELGRGAQLQIGHTQPRRIAARTVAERIATELGGALGGLVGYKVRFTDRVGADTRVKLMTDGILLAEIAHDRELRRYDTIIIDEAHERSLNVDFLLGYLKRLLPRRPDLKLIITSATIDPERFSRHFDGAPVITVSGRTYPVEVRYRPLVAEDGGEDRDQTQGILDAVDELAAEGPGDILVFLSGEREIRDTAEALRDHAVRRRALRDVEVLPLYGRLSAAEQHRVFSPSRGRRIVLATNVAETSLTVPGIRFVVDPGTARISRYSPRTKVQRLPIEPVSQASADQRKGRCGRVAAGICIRLYAEEDFAARPAFTDPEILRTNLASVILQMASLDLGEVADFPFLDPPDRRSITDGVRLLEELGALDAAQKQGRARLTATGRKLAQLPVDPRFARMVVEADRTRCVAEVLVIVAALSIQDPRERPAEHQQAADESHARFADPDSDFLAYLNLWRYLREQADTLSSNQFRRRCRAEYLNHLRVREWQDLYAQLRQAARSAGITPSSAPDDRQAIAVAVLSGLLSHIGLKADERNEYLGARNLRFAVFPGSALYRKPPRWVMAAELVETSRLWGRVAARIDPGWVEPLAAHLVTRSYSEPHWEPARGAAMALEKVTLYGLPIVAGRRVNVARFDPALARELFVRHALVEGDWEAPHAFLADNRRLLAEVEQLEQRARRRDLVVDDEALFAFYDARVPADVTSARHFDRWWRRADQPVLLHLDRATLLGPAAAEVDPADYPDLWEPGGLRLPLTYRFSPGAADDGVTVTVPLLVLNRAAGLGLDWQVPGLREELVSALIRSLPKPLRRGIVPAGDAARAVLARVDPGREPLLGALERGLRAVRGVAVPRQAWQLDQVPAHLRMQIRVVDGAGRVVGEGRDLGVLQRRLRGAQQAALASAAGGLERRGLQTWDLGELPRTLTVSSGGHEVRAHPALVDEGDSVAVRLLGSAAEQEQAMWQGTRRLLLLGVPSVLRYVQGRLPNATKLALTSSPYRDLAELLGDATLAAADALLARHGGPAWDADGFRTLRESFHRELGDAVLGVLTDVGRILPFAARVTQRLDALVSPALAPAVDDVRAQLGALVPRGFVGQVGSRRLGDLLRYLRAIEVRLDTLARDPHRDRERMDAVARTHQAYLGLLGALPTSRRVAEDVRAIRWMIEELRVSAFAQAIGTPTPISEQRILRAIDQLTP